MSPSRKPRTFQLVDDCPDTNVDHVVFNILGDTVDALKHLIPFFGWSFRSK
jgi:hypothetical protein